MPQKSLRSHAALRAGGGRLRPWVGELRGPGVAQSPFVPSGLRGLGGPGELGRPTGPRTASHYTLMSL